MVERRKYAVMRGIGGPYFSIFGIDLIDGLLASARTSADKLAVLVERLGLSSVYEVEKHLERMLAHRLCGKLDRSDRLGRIPALFH